MYNFTSKFGITLLSGCKVTTNNSFLQELRAKSCKKVHIYPNFVHKIANFGK